MKWEIADAERGIFRFEESCNVYAIVRGADAVLIDSGTGVGARRLGQIGVKRVAHVLHTHHHRDQAEGSLGLSEQGTAIWVPSAEQELFAHVDAFWGSVDLYNNYRGAQTRDTLLKSIPVTGVLEDYASWSWPEHPDVSFRIVPTPGHTMGSVSLLWGDLAFTGDLLYAPGKVWSVAAFQYDYVQLPGAQLAIRSLKILEREGVRILCPSHGPLMVDAPRALTETGAALSTLLAERGKRYVDELAGQDRPLDPVLPHLLRDRESVSSTWVVLSGDGHALLIDYGYSHWMYMTQYGGPRWGKRPILHGIEQLREEYGVQAIDAVIVSHHHDDHVAAMPALRRALGAEVWALETMVDVLVRPHAYKTQCLWFDPIPVDRVLRRGETIRWRGLPILFDEERGHTRWGSLAAFEVDGTRCLAIGDQFPNNFVYANYFELGDYVATARRWRELKPDLILPGHGPEESGPAYVNELERNGRALDDIHRQLLPLEDWNLGAGGVRAEIVPYQATVKPGEWVEVTIRARNPLYRSAVLEGAIEAPAGWAVVPPVRVERVEVGEEAVFRFQIQAGARPGWRQRYGVRLTLEGRPLGTVEEAFLHIESDRSGKGANDDDTI